MDFLKSSCTGGETEAQRDQASCLRSHSEQSFDPGFVWFQTRHAVQFPHSSNLPSARSFLSTMKLDPYNYPAKQVLFLSPVCRPQTFIGEGKLFSREALGSEDYLQIYDSNIAKGRQGGGEKGIPGGYKRPGSCFNPAEVLSQEDWQIKPQTLICPL